VRFLSCEPLLGPLDGINLGSIDWVIAGGESGPNFRPIDPQWVRHIRDTCTAADVPFFFKQWGGRTPKAFGRELDGRCWDEMPLIEIRNPDPRTTSRVHADPMLATAPTESAQRSNPGQLVRQR
ncbi:DUF5131 family protein, partial [Mycobacterium tuberculosis]